MYEYLPIIFFIVAFILILIGYPVAFTLGGVAVIVGVWMFDVDFFYLLSLRIFGTMQNFVLLGVPLFVFMGMMLEKSGIAEKLLETMALLFGKFKGGLALSVIVVGALLAASTGIVGATVVTMGLISLPTMLKRGYAPTLAMGTIAASGTLGQIIPPSVVLVLLASVLNVSVGALFLAAIVPGFCLIGMYMIYVIIYAQMYPNQAPAMPPEEVAHFRNKGFSKEIIQSFLLPLLLVILVLGTIIGGIASPTEAAGIGAMGALILTAYKGKLNKKILGAVTKETLMLTSMVFMILIGATAFSLVFRGLEGDKLFLEMISKSNLGPNGFLILVMILVFIAGFFIDFIEIIFIVVPIVAPIFASMGVDLVWIGILLAINLQTSFLTPPFGFALFYLKGVAPPEIKTKQLYIGVLPFVVIQIIFLGLLILFPQLLKVF
ncbi:TRAP transporter large permease subunit [Cyclobacteriaceae bacterium]|jgi:tripartite ATP-independent transporter DctM subunit|nr:TRAP transporter large permease subunit [Cyclobacteriaceae bacterium]MDB9939201.1 TRAP transporter large permease subunit [Cyclobacteriaceae bacterium]MDC6484011.1 TRAP transporter large permease subunit [Cyclobacteriaceae bacterium]|tara:strand:+ start:2480 stop:3781 length:1302 start_codon:yes stop_codon:yes gene_type:complete